MNYEQLENDIVTRLAPFAAAGVSVIKMPELETERSLPEPQKAQFTVMYAGSEYENVNSTAQVSQMETVFVAVLIESNLLRGPKGVYNLLSVLKTALIGFKPANCHRLQAVKHHTLGSPEAVRKDNTWQYQAVFKTTTLTVEAFTEDLSVLLKKITLIDVPDGEIIVIPNTDN
jgi:hypothetical protein